jgi:hypothetical protein
VLGSERRGGVKIGLVLLTMAVVGAGCGSSHNSSPAVKFTVPASDPATISTAPPTNPSEAAPTTPATVPPTTPPAPPPPRSSVANLEALTASNDVQSVRNNCFAGAAPMSCFWYVATLEGYLGQLMREVDKNSGVGQDLQRLDDDALASNPGTGTISFNLFGHINTFLADNAAAVAASG